MNILKLPGIRSSGYDVTTSNTAAGAGEYYVEVIHQEETAAEMYDRLSNSAADGAVVFGATGYATTAQIAAELADAYATLAAVSRRAS